MMMTERWEDRLIDDPAEAIELLRTANRIAVLGIKTPAQAGQPAYSVPRYLQNAGYEIVPVPVYYPEVQEILGEPVYRRVSDVPGEIDLVVVFRKSRDVPPHVEDLLSARPQGVWFQSGIRHDESARRLAEAGIRVVQDRCTMVDHHRIA